MLKILYTGRLGEFAVMSVQLTFEMCLCLKARKIYQNPPFVDSCLTPAAGKAAAFLRASYGYYRGKLDLCSQLVVYIAC